VAPGPPPEPDVALYPPAESPVALPDEPVRLVVWPPTTRRTELVSAMLERDGSTIVVAPEPAEVQVLASALRDLGRHVVLLRGDLSRAARTDAWDEARRGACVVVGGRIAVWAPLPDLRGVVVLDDADEALAEERAPAWHARELAVERARRCGARCSIVTPVPTVEAAELAGGAAVVAPRQLTGRGWPRLHVVDLRDEPPGVGLLSSALGPVLHRALDVPDGRALCILNRRGRAHLLVCRACGEVARCERCDARLAEDAGAFRCERCDARPAAQCRACGAGVFRKLRPGVTGLRDALAGLVPHARVIAVDASSAPLPAFDVAVGTEALLHRVPHAAAVRLVAFLDLDQELLAPRFRAAEQALWLLVRAARVLGSRRDAELLVQTRLVGHEVVRAVSTGEVAPVIEAETRRRRDLRLPPFGGLAELSGDLPAVEHACALLGERLAVAGPSAGRALVRSSTVAELCDAIAGVDLSPARARGRLRIDVDPLRV
jgi:primosomal protein N' (replication factor Y)